MELICKTKNNISSKDLYKIYVCAHEDEYDSFVSFIVDKIHKKHNCAIFYKQNPSKIIDEKLLSEFDLIIVYATKLFLCNPNIAKDIELKSFKKNNINILPILEDINLEIEYTACFNNLQYLSNFSKGKGAISFDDKLNNYLSERIIPTPLINKIINSFTATLFLSYRKIDRELAQQIIKIIHSHPQFYKIAIWYDEYLTLGEDFDNSIQKALDESMLFLLALTKNMVNEDNYVSKHEFPDAKKKNIPIIPILLEQVEESILNSRFPGLPTCIALDNNYEIIKTINNLLKEKGIELSTSECPDYLIAIAYFMGIYLERNIEIAISIFKKLATENVEEAINMLSLIYFNGDRVNKDINLAIKYQKKLVKIKKNKYESSKLLVEFRSYLNSNKMLMKMYMENANYLKAIKLAKKIEKLNEYTHHNEYKVSVFDEIMQLFKYSNKKMCLDMAKNHILYGNYYSLAAIAYRIIKITDKENQKQCALDFFDILNKRFLNISKYNFSSNKSFKNILGHIIKDFNLDYDATDYLSEINQMPTVEKNNLSIEDSILKDDLFTPKSNKFFDEYLFDTIIPNFELTCEDYFTSDIKNFFKCLKINNKLKRKQYSFDNEFKDIKKASLYAKRLSLRNGEIAINTSKQEQLDEKSYEWLLNFSYQLNDEKIAKQVANIYENIVTSFYNNKVFIYKLSETYKYLSEVEPYNYIWLEKYAISQMMIVKKLIIKKDYMTALTSSLNAYKYMKKYVSVNNEKEYLYHLGLSCFCLAFTYEFIDKEESLNYYNEAFNILLNHSDDIEEKGKNQLIALYLNTSYFNDESGIEDIKKAISIIDDFNQSDYKDYKLSQAYAAYGKIYEKLQDNELALYYKRKTVETLKTLYLNDKKSYESIYIKSLIELAEFYYVIDENKCSSVISEAISLCDLSNNESFLKEVLISRSYALKGWLCIKNQNYQKAIEHFNNSIFKIENSNFIEESSQIRSVLYSSYKGLYVTYNNLNMKKLAKENFKKAVKYAMKDFTAGYLFDSIIQLFD